MKQPPKLVYDYVGGVRLPKQIAARVRDRAARANMTPYEYVARLITDKCAPELAPLLNRPKSSLARRRPKVVQVQKLGPELPPATQPKQTDRPSPENCAHPPICRVPVAHRGIWCSQCEGWLP